MAVGETVEEATTNGHDALVSTIAALQAKGFPSMRLLTFIAEGLGRREHHV